MRPNEEKSLSAEAVQAGKPVFDAHRFFRYAIPVWTVVAVIVGLVFLPLSLPILIYQFLKKRFK